MQFIQIYFMLICFNGSYLFDSLQFILKGILRMGQVFQSVLNGGKTKQQAADLKDFLTISEQMLRNKAELFFQRIVASAKERKELPISKFLQKRFEMRVSLQQGVNIGENVQKIASSFADEKFAKGVGQIISSVTGSIFGRQTGQSDEEEGYFVVVGTAGAILRIDYLVYLKIVNSKGLICLAQNFYLCAYTIASVDTSNLTYNDISSIVEMNYASLPTQDRQQLIENVEHHLGQRSKAAPKEFLVMSKSTLKYSEQRQAQSNTGQQAKQFSLSPQTSKREQQIEEEQPSSQYKPLSYPSLQISSVSSVQQAEDETKLSQSTSHEQPEKAFTDQEQLLNIEMEEIHFLLHMVDQFQLVEKEIGPIPFIMMAYNLTKYHIILFKKFYTTLNPRSFTKKYPGMDWESYFLTSELAERKREYVKAIHVSEVRYTKLYNRCKQHHEKIWTTNECFMQTFKEKITETTLQGEFFRSYRKSTNIVYAIVKDYLKTNKDSRFYCYLCIICIAHVFNELYESNELKLTVFSIFSDKVRESTVKGNRISYKKVGDSLCNSSKQVVLTLAKTIINDVMMKTK